jgi:hypothetical protein
MKLKMHAAAVAAAFAAGSVVAGTAGAAPAPAATDASTLQGAPAGDVKTDHHLPGRKKFHIRFQGGRVMTGPNAVYALYYGDFPLTGARNDTRAILDDFLTGVGATPNFAVNSGYYDAQGTPVPASLAYDRATNSYVDDYSFGPQPNDGQIPKILARALSLGYLPVDDNGVYVVFTSPDAAKRIATCAFHHWTDDLVPGHTIVWASVPVFGAGRSRALKACSGNFYMYKERNSPNDNLPADTAIDSAFHEISEAITDPEQTGWVSDEHGIEDGDPCTFRYEQAYLAPNGTHADVNFGGRDYLIQSLWANDAPTRCAHKP